MLGGRGRRDAQKHHRFTCAAPVGLGESAQATQRITGDRRVGEAWDLTDPFDSSPDWGETLLDATAGWEVATWPLNAWDQLLQRNLLYTGVTRGKRLVVLVGQKKAVAIAVKNASGRRRWSKLNEWLAAPFSPPRQP